MKNEMILGNLVLKIQQNFPEPCDVNLESYFFKGKNIAQRNKQNLLDSREFIDWLDDLFIPLLKSESYGLTKEDERKLIVYFPEVESLMSDIKNTEPKPQYSIVLIALLIGIIIGLLLG